MFLVCGCGFYTPCYDHVMCAGGEEGGFYICGYVLNTMSKMGLCVSECVSFNCNAFLAKLYIWNRSRVFHFWPFSINKISIVLSIEFYPCQVSSICCANFELCLLVLMA
jgi:hypothetical protein